MTSTNPQIELARKVIETTCTHLFLTGKAGTGKTTFLRQLRNALPKRMVVLAPTGIAAINAEGVTIHSFFQLPFAPHVPGAKYAQPSNYGFNRQKIKLIRSIDLLVIDEISMVRADLLDAVDEALRRIRRNNQPFGGVQLLLIGDLQQLSPVVKEEEWHLIGQYYETPYFFSSLALRNTRLVTIELEHVYRQSDTKFLALLNAIREGLHGTEVLNALNRRVIPNFNIPADDGYIRLVTHNKQAQAANDREMDALSGKPFTYHAEINGIFPEYSYPTEAALTLKIGAQIMFVKNDPNKRFFNGMIGKIIAIDAKGFRVCPNEHPDQTIDVKPETWTNVRYGLDAKTQEITEIVDGTFTQYPVKAAWAITIHKSQGLTFDRVVIDASGAFAHGQTYVALSRCRTLEGIVLTSPIPPRAIIADKSVSNFNHLMRNNHITEASLNQMRNEYALHLLGELFAFDNERIALAKATRIIEEDLSRVFPETLKVYNLTLRNYDLEVMGVSSRFSLQYKRLLEASNGDITCNEIQERLKKGAAYFEQKLAELKRFLRLRQPEADNAEIQKRLTAAHAEALNACKLHRKLLKTIEDEGFELKKYLNRRAAIIIESEQDVNGTLKNGKAKNLNTPTVPAEVSDKALYQKLAAWRREKAAEKGKPAYTVLQTKAMIALTNLHPKNAAELAETPNIGKKGLELYGRELLELLGADTNDFSMVIRAKQAKESEKEPKERTNEVSLRLYGNGLSVNEIAAERGLKPLTIKMHLAAYTASGQVDICDLVPRKNLERVENYLQLHPTDKQLSLTELRQKIGDDLPFEDLRILLIYWSH